MRSGQSDPGAAEIAAFRWRVVGLLMAISALNYFSRISMSVAGERLMAESSLSATRMGWVYSALLIAYTVCMVPGGWFSDRQGAWTGLVAAGLGSAIFCALTGLAGFPALTAAGLLFPALLLVRALMGVFIAPLYPAAGRVVTACVPFRRRALANGLVTGAATVGIALAPPLFGLLMDATGWRWAFVITGAGMGLLSLLWARYGPRGPGPRRPPSTAPTESPAVSEGAVWRGILGSRSLWLLTASSLAVGYVEYLIFYWSGYYFGHVLHLSEGQGRVATMGPPLALGAGIAVGGWLSDRLAAALGQRLGRSVVAATGMIAGGLALTAGTFTTNAPLTAVWFTFAFGGMGFAEAAGWTTAFELGRARAATSAAVVNTGTNIGGFISPVITPWVSEILTPSLGEEIAWAWGMRLGGLVCLVGAGPWFWIGARNQESGGQRFDRHRPGGDQPSIRTTP